MIRITRISTTREVIIIFYRFFLPRIHLIVSLCLQTEKSVSGNKSQSRTCREIFFQPITSTADNKMRIDYNILRGEKRDLNNESFFTVTWGRIKS